MTQTILFVYATYTMQNSTPSGTKGSRPNIPSSVACVRCKNRSFAVAKTRLCEYCTDKVRKKKEDDQLHKMFMEAHYEKMRKYYKRRGYPSWTLPVSTRRSAKSRRHSASVET